MQINKLSVASHSTLNFELDPVRPITVFYGRYASAALNLINELICSHSSFEAAGGPLGGRFIIHADIEDGGKEYSVCYIRNAESVGDCRIGVNFKPASTEFSREDTVEFLKKRDAVYHEGAFPDFLYWQNGTHDPSVIADYVTRLATSGRQVFLAVPDGTPAVDLPGVLNVTLD